MPDLRSFCKVIGHSGFHGRYNRSNPKTVKEYRVELLQRTRLNLIQVFLFVLSTSGCGTVHRIKTSGPQETSKDRMKRK